MSIGATNYFEIESSIQDLRHLSWDVNPAYTKGTAGTFLKSIDKKRAPMVYYKLSAGDTISGIYGHEAANEVIVSRFLDILGIPHLGYKGSLSKIVLGGKECVVYVCCSENFRRGNESKLALDSYYELCGNDFCSVEEMLRQNGYSDYLDRMILVDFLVINCDRHGANLEVLYTSEGDVILSPLFDHGFSLLAPLQNHVEMIEAFDAMRDVEANNFIGSRSLFGNLELIKKPVNVIPLDTGNLAVLFEGMSNVLSSSHVRKIIEIIERRYNYAKSKKVLCEVGR